MPPPGSQSPIPALGPLGEAPRTPGDPSRGEVLQSRLEQGAKGRVSKGQNPPPSSWLSKGWLWQQALLARPCRSSGPAATFWVLETDTSGVFWEQK